MTDSRINPQTNRSIKVGGPKYKELIEKGYIDNGVTLVKCKPVIKYVPPGSINNVIQDRKEMIADDVEDAFERIEDIFNVASDIIGIVRDYIFHGQCSHRGNNVYECMECDAKICESCGAYCDAHGYNDEKVAVCKKHVYSCDKCEGSFCRLHIAKQLPYKTKTWCTECDEEYYSHS